MDPIGWFIATTHQMLGHDKSAALAGQTWTGDKADCLLCQYEADPTPERKEAVIAAIGTTTRADNKTLCQAEGTN